MPFFGGYILSQERFVSKTTARSIIYGKKYCPRSSKRMSQPNKAKLGELHYSTLLFLWQPLPTDQGLLMVTSGNLLCSCLIDYYPNIRVVQERELMTLEWSAVRVLIAIISWLVHQCWLHSVATTLLLGHQIALSGPRVATLLIGISCRRRK